MTKKLLIVSPHFPPINAPDCQRIRMSLPYFREFGWEPYVLTVRPESVDGAFDALLEQTIPGSTKIIRTAALPLEQTSKVGFRNLALRSLPYLRSAGNSVLQKEAIDLVYFSTTMFPVMTLGRLWRRRFGVPYVLDFQDPWLSDYYSRPQSLSPPGGKVKYAMSRALARFLEPYAMRRVSHVISVSSEYQRVLLERYSWLKEDQFTVLPFGASESDFDFLQSSDVKQTIFDPSDGKRHWVFVGVVPTAMNFALRALFAAIRNDRASRPENWMRIKVHFVGTSYSQGRSEANVVVPIAQEFGIGDMVEEQSSRIPYFEALRVLVDSDAILLIGSDDPGYTASKLYPCILAKKPILAVFHEQSSVVEILRRCNAGHAVTFSTDEDPANLLDTMIEQLDWLLSCPKGFSPATDWSAFHPYTAKETTRVQCAIFDRCISSRVELRMASPEQ